jgi:dTDP-4-dehydrorhamnose reductase
VLAEKQRDKPWGVYHIAGAGSATWYEFAKEISNNLVRAGNRKIALESISTAQYTTATTRPPNCMLDFTKFESTFSLRLPAWREGVQASVQRWIRTVNS